MSKHSNNKRRSDTDQMLTAAYEAGWDDGMKAAVDALKYGPGSDQMNFDLIGALQLLHDAIEREQRQR